MKWKVMGFWFKADVRYISGLTPKRREKLRREAMQVSSTLKENARVVCEAGKCVIAR
jgi:hypothetical protein